MSIWEELGIDPTSDARAIKRAYARRLKQAHPEEDPSGFQKLRAAYERALATTDRSQKRSTQSTRPAPSIADSKNGDRDQAEAVVPFASRYPVLGAAMPPPLTTAIVATEDSGRTPADTAKLLEEIYQRYGERTASTFLRSLCKGNENWDEYGRGWFEVAVARWLNSLDDLPQPLLSTADEVFSWSAMIDAPGRSLLDPDRERIVRGLELKRRLAAFEQSLNEGPTPAKRRRMVELLRLPYRPEELRRLKRALPIVARVTWNDDFRELVAELRRDYADLEDLGIDCRTAEFWCAPSPRRSAVWRGGFAASAIAALLGFGLIFGGRAAGDLQKALYPWWVELSWFFVVFFSASRIWFNRRRRFFGVLCGTLLWLPKLTLPGVHVLSIVAGFVALWSGTSLARAWVYGCLVIGGANQFFGLLRDPLILLPLVWASEVLRFGLERLHAAHPESRFQHFMAPDWAWVPTLSVYFALTYPSTHVLIPASFAAIFAIIERQGWYRRASKTTLEKSRKIVGS